MSLITNLNKATGKKLFLRFFTFRSLIFSRKNEWSRKKNINVKDRDGKIDMRNHWILLPPSFCLVQFVVLRISPPPKFISFSSSEIDWFSLSVFFVNPSTNFLSLPPHSHSILAHRSGWRQTTTLFYYFLYSSPIFPFSFLHFFHVHFWAPRLSIIFYSLFLRFIFLKFS